MSTRSALMALLLAPTAVTALSVQAPGIAAAGPALVFEVETSRVLYAEAPDANWYPASLTKLMTAYLVFDAMKREQVSGQAEIIVSPYANSQPRMRVGVGAGKRITVDEALAGLIIHSANDLAVALAEAVAGTEDEFVSEMNEAAVKLGMYQTRFANANGLPKDGQMTTARDMAILARALLRDFPEWQHIYATPSARVGRRVVSSHNDILQRFEGADGMKTGFTCGAGYNVVASAKRDGRRIVAVVLGEPSNRARTTRAEDLLTKAYAMPPAGADATLLDLAPESGEALLDGPRHEAAPRAADLMKIRHCYPVPPPPTVVAASPEADAAAPSAAVTASDGAAVAAVPGAGAVAAPVTPASGIAAGQGAATKSANRKVDPKKPALGRPNQQQSDEAVSQKTAAGRANTKDTAALVAQKVAPRAPAASPLAQSLPASAAEGANDDDDSADEAPAPKKSVRVARKRPKAKPTAGAPEPELSLTESSN